MINLLDLNRDGKNDWYQVTEWYGNTAGKVWGSLFQGVGNVAAPVLESIGAGVGKTAVDIGGGLFRGLTSNIGGIALIGLAAYMVMKK